MKLQDCNTYINKNNTELNIYKIVTKTLNLIQFLKFGGTHCDITGFSVYQFVYSSLLR